MNIGERIKKRRIELGWSQRELARRMGYKDNTTLTKIERGLVNVSQARAIQFAQVLGVSFAYLANWEQEAKKNDIQTDIILRMRTDNLFGMAVENLYKLDREKLEIINQMLNTFLK